MPAPDSFYVYIGFHPVTGEPCYVGKGHGRRKDRHNALALAGNHHNPHFARIVAKHGPVRFEIESDHLTEADAFALERRLIAKHGRANQGGILCNMTDGGDGPAGMKLSEETHRRMSAAQRKRVDKRNEARLDYYERSRALKVAYPPRGPMSDEHKAKIAAANRGKSKSAETRARMAEGKKGVRLTPAHCRAISAGRRRFRLAGSQSDPLAALS